MLKRTAKSCGSDAPRLASSPAEASRPNRAWTKPYPQDDGGKTAWSPRRARRKPLKPLRGECRLNPSEPVVTMLVCFVFYRTRGCGCSEHPAFPAPSVFFGRMDFAQLGRLAPRDRGGATSLRGGQRRGNPLFYFAAPSTPISATSTVPVADSVT